MTLRFQEEAGQEVTDGEPKGLVRWCLRAWLYAEAVGAVLAVAFGLFFWKPWVAPLPDAYHLKVQVLDPSGLPVQDAKVRVSVGNEPQLLADGWWEVEIPRAKVPVDELVTVWVEHAHWQGSREDVFLGKDPNPHVEVRLQEPEERTGGVVVGRDGRGVVGDRISVRNFEAEPVVTTPVSKDIYEVRFMK